MVVRIERSEAPLLLMFISRHSQYFTPAGASEPQHTTHNTQPFRFAPRVDYVCRSADSTRDVQRAGWFRGDSPPAGEGQPNVCSRSLFTLLSVTVCRSHSYVYLTNLENGIRPKHVAATGPRTAGGVVCGVLIGAHVWGNRCIFLTVSKWRRRMLYVGQSVTVLLELRVCNWTQKPCLNALLRKPVRLFRRDCFERFIVRRRSLLMQLCVFIVTKIRAHVHTHIHTHMRARKTTQTPTRVRTTHKNTNERTSVHINTHA